MRSALKDAMCQICSQWGEKAIEVFAEKRQVGPANVSLGWTIKEVMECSILMKNSVWEASYPFPWQLFPVKYKWSLNIWFGLVYWANGT